MYLWSDVTDHWLWILILSVLSSVLMKTLWLIFQTLTKGCCQIHEICAVDHVILNTSEFFMNSPDVPQASWHYINKILTGLMQRRRQQGFENPLVYLFIYLLFCNVSQWKEFHYWKWESGKCGKFKCLAFKWLCNLSDFRVKVNIKWHWHHPFSYIMYFFRYFLVKQNIQWEFLFFEVHPHFDFMLVLKCFMNSLK